MRDRPDGARLVGRRSTRWQCLRRAASLETTQLRQHYYGFARDAKGFKRLLRQVRTAQACPVCEIRVRNRNRNRNQFSSRDGPNQTGPGRSTRCASPESVSTTTPRAPRTASRRESASGFGSGTPKTPPAAAAAAAALPLPLPLPVAKAMPVMAMPPLARPQLPLTPRQTRLWPRRKLLRR